ncbi:hypothetical protein CR513_54012, partial [Mucuna pruriens]
MLAKQLEGHELYLYLAVFEYAINVVVVQEQGKKQTPVYCINKVLQEAETRENDYMVDRAIRFELRGAIKSQALANFVVMDNTYLEILKKWNSKGKKERASRYLIEAEALYKWGFSMPLLKCLTKSENLVYRYGLPYSMVTNNGRQFISNYLLEFYEGLGSIHRVTSVEHPQTKEQVEVANKVEQKDYRSNNYQASFKHIIVLRKPLLAKLLFDAMIPVEVGEPLIRQGNFNTKDNEGAI